MKSHLWRKCPVRSGATLLSLLLASAAFAVAQTPTFISFNAPDAGTGQYQGTYPIAINLHGFIAGSYIDARNQQHGFIRKANGEFIDFTPTHMVDITVTALNNSGQVVGTGSTVLTPPYEFSGFLRNPNATYAIFAPSGAVYTDPLAINDSGIITGYYYDAAGNYHGFLRQPGGAITIIDNPDASTGAGKGTWATSINADASISGFYTDVNTGTFRAFLRDSLGNFTNFDVDPGVTAYPYLTFVNLNGEVAGVYAGVDNLSYGFLRDISGNVTDFSVPGAYQTTPTALDDNGVIVGYYSAQSSGTVLAFERDATGSFMTFSAPNPNLLTIAAAINDTGRVTGYWRDSSYNDHGFVK